MRENFSRGLQNAAEKFTIERRRNFRKGEKIMNESQNKITLPKLIAELCPDGVEFKKLGDVCEIRSGWGFPILEQGNKSGEYPFYKVGDMNLPGNEHFMTVANNYVNSDVSKKLGCNPAPKGTTIFPKIGAAIATNKKRLLLNSSCYDNNVMGIIPGNDLVPEFLFYLFDSVTLIDFADYSGAMPSIRKSTIEKYRIPLPPIEVQREIVRILDKFTELILLLEKERIMRKKQYEYYGEKLLTFSNDVPRVRLGEVIISLNTGLNPRKFFRLNSDDAQNYYVTIREMHNNRIVFSKKTDRINDEALRLCNKRANLEIGDVLFSGTGTIGEVAVIEKTPTNWSIKEGVYTIKPKKEQINSKFLMHLLTSSQMKTLYLKKAAGGTVKSIPMQEMRNFEIPLPPLSEQKRIADMLDRFDALCNDTTSGIPAEIAARKKQYEYYRDRLLTFREKIS